MINKIYNATLNKFNLVSKDSAKSLEDWLSNLVDVALTITLVFAPIALYTNIINFSNNDMWFGIVFDSVGYLILLFIRFSPKASYKLKAHTFIWISYLISILAYILFGLSGDGRVLAVFLASFATLLLGLRWGLFFLMLNMGTFIFIGYGMVNGLIVAPPTSIQANSTLALGWLTTGSTLVFTGLTTIFAIGMAIKFLNESYKKEQRTSEQLKLLTSRLISMQENERSEIARNLHDEILNTMAVMTLDLDELTTFDDMKYHIKKLSAQIRHTINGLRPPVLDFGLYTSLDQLIDNLEERLDDTINLHFDIKLSECRYDPDVEQHIYRIVQQACENAIKHGKPDTLKLVGDISSEYINLKVNDNGQGFDTRDGFDTTQLLIQKRYGLVNMIDRANLIGAIIKIDSTLGAGTTVNVEWKLADFANGNKTL